MRSHSIHPFHEIWWVYCDLISCVKKCIQLTMCCTVIVRRNLETSMGYALSMVFYVQRLLQITKCDLNPSLKVPPIYITNVWHPQYCVWMLHKPMLIWNSLGDSIFNGDGDGDVMQHTRYLQLPPSVAGSCCSARIITEWANPFTSIASLNLYCTVNKRMRCSTIPSKYHIHRYNGRCSLQRHSHTHTHPHTHTHVRPRL